MSWSEHRLDEVADFHLGKMLDQAKNRGEMRPYLANVNVRWGAFDLADLREMRFTDSEMDRYSVKRGDILMCEGGEPGRCALWNSDQTDMMFQKALHRIRPHPCLDSTFLFYSLLNLKQTNGFEPLVTGAAIKHLPREQLAKLKVRFPKLRIQRSIASVLEAYDDLIATNQRRIALLEDAARRLYREWFVHLRFPGHESVPVKDGVPHGWCTDALEKALFLQRGFDLPSGDRVPGDVPIYASTGINGFHNAAKVTGPGVVTGRSGTLGVVHYVTQDHWPLNTALWVKEFRAVSPLFAFFMLTDLKLEQFNSGASVPTLDRKVVHQLAVLIPEKEVIRQFDEAVQPLFEQVDVLRSANASAVRARDLLLPQLMSGQLNVSGISVPNEVCA